MGKKFTNKTEFVFKCRNRSGKIVKKGPYVVEHHLPWREHIDGSLPLIKKLRKEGYTVLSYQIGNVRVNIMGSKPLGELWITEKR